MHLLQTTSASLDDIVEPVDLGQTPGDIVVLSFADSDLAGLAAAYAAEADRLPSLRLAHLRDLRHPMSIDLWIDTVARHAKVIVVRLLGGLDWWRYGVETLAAAARERNIALAVLPGEDRTDQRLDQASTLPADELAALLAFFREGGRDNLRALLRRLAGHAGLDLDAPPAANRAAHRRLCAGHGRGEPRSPCRRTCPGTRGGAGHLLSRGATRRRHSRHRRAVRGARRARAGAGAIGGAESEGSRRRRVRARSASSGSRLPSSSPPRLSRPAARARPRRSIASTRRCCKR